MNRSLFPSLGFLTAAPVAAALAAVVCLLSPTVLHAQEVPFTGQVVEPGTQIHSGTGRAYYKVGKLNKGDTVTVVKVVYGWNEIRAPKGVYSYISRGFVDARGDGSTGVVNKSQAPVKAASIDGPPGNSYHIQLKLEKGDTVQILDTAGDFYKIAPPDGAYVFLPPGSVRRVRGVTPTPQPRPENHVGENSPQNSGAEKNSASGNSRGAATSLGNDNHTTAPAMNNESNAGSGSAMNHSAATSGGESDTAGENVNHTTAPANPIPATNNNTDNPTLSRQDQNDGSASPANPTGESSRSAAIGDNANTTANTDVNDNGEANDEAGTGSTTTVDQVIGRVFEGSKLPRNPSRLKRMTATLQEAIDGDQLTETKRRRAKRALTVLRFEQRRQAAIKGATAAIDQAQVPAKMPPTELERREQLPVSVRYDATGVLMASSVFDGQNLPRLYRIVNNGRTVVYVKPGRKVDARRLLGRAVGVIGTKHRDPATKQQVIDIKKIDPLNARSRPSGDQGGQGGEESEQAPAAGQ